MIISATPPRNLGIVPPWLQEPWPVPVGPDIPRIFCDHSWYSNPDDRQSCRDCNGVGGE